MTLRVDCACGAKLHVPESAAGKKGKCSKCGRALQIPKHDKEVSPSATMTNTAIEKDVKPQTDAKDTFPLRKVADAGHRPAVPVTADVDAEAGEWDFSYEDDSYEDNVDGNYGEDYLKKLRKAKKRGSGKHDTERRVRCPACGTVFHEPFDGSESKLATMKLVWLVHDGPFSHCPKCKNHFDLKCFTPAVFALVLSACMFALLHHYAPDLLRDVGGFAPDLPNLWGLELLVVPFFTGLKNDAVIGFLIIITLPMLALGGLFAAAFGLWRMGYAIYQRL